MTSHADWVTNGGVQDPGSIIMYGGSLTGISGYTNPPNYIGDTSTSVTIYFTASSTDAVIAWGGHIAERDDWGEDNSAVAIPGSPYHMRLLDMWDVTNNNKLNVGNTDRSLSAEAVYYPSSITIIKDTVPDHPQDFNFSTTGGLIPATFILDDDVDPTYSNTQYYGLLYDYKIYTVSETPVNGWTLSFNNPVCTITSANGGSQSVLESTVTINLKEGENVTCTFINTLNAFDLTATKTAAGTYDRTVTWDLSKSVAPAIHEGNAGDSFNSIWEVVATKAEESNNYTVTGQITINNPNTYDVPVTVSDTLSDGTVAAVDCDSLTAGDQAFGSVPALGNLVCSYTALPADGSTTSNTATITSGDPNVGGTSATRISPGRRT